MGRPKSEPQDLTGQKFNNLTVIERAESRDKRGRPYWLCLCDCSNTTTVRSDALKNGSVASCGCLKAISSKQSTNETHGLSKERLYTTWHNIKKRCYVESSINYPYYGGRGITMCDEWLESVESFIEWSHNNNYQDSLTIDRMDVDGNYEPSNCKWVTQKEQSINKTNNVYVTINGESKTIPEWAEATGINKFTLRKRYRLGWRDEKLIQPVR